MTINSAGRRSWRQSGLLGSGRGGGGRNVRLGVGAAGRDVGGILDLGNPGARILDIWGKIFPQYFPGLKPMGIHQKVIRIDCYDDLLLPGHRLLAQIALEASVEHFRFTNLPISEKTWTVHGAGGANPSGTFF